MSFGGVTWRLLRWRTRQLPPSRPRGAASPPPARHRRRRGSARRRVAHAVAVACGTDQAACASAPTSHAPCFSAAARPAAHRARISRAHRCQRPSGVAARPACAMSLGPHVVGCSNNSLDLFSYVCVSSLRRGHANRLPAADALRRRTAGSTVAAQRDVVGRRHSCGALLRAFRHEYGLRAACSAACRRAACSARRAAAALRAYTCTPESRFAARACTARRGRLAGPAGRRAC